jgi:hypothetical protein
MENRLSLLLRSLGCFLMLSLLLSLFACQTTPTGQSYGPAAMHAIHSRQLKTVMSDISDVALERLPQEIVQSSNSGGGRPDLGKVANTAGTLTRSAAKILPAVNTVDLEPAEKEVFLSLARRLKSQSANLQAQARRGDLSNARLSMRQISGTCNSCHALFRDHGSFISLIR